MRIGIDMTGCQAPGSRRRGIGRYSRSFVNAFLARGRGHEIFLYVDAALPTDDLPDADIRAIPPAETLARAFDRLTTANPDGLDVLLITSPFEIIRGYMTPARPLGRLGLAAIVYDLIPYLFPDDYQTHWAFTPHYHRVLQRVRRYDALLAISEATRQDVIRHLDVPPGRVANIRGASDPGEFRPAVGPMTDEERRDLARLGIDSPFVFYVSGHDPRKNTAGLIRAFARLPGTLRLSHRLVVSCALNANDAQRVRLIASCAGIEDRLILTNEISDETLGLLYRRCDLFVFPSLYEGFGLPLLEAMHSGAPVVAGDNSSQPEVVGDAGLLVDASDDADVASGIARVLDDPALARTLRSRATARAGTFSWPDVADRALAALEAIEPRRPARRIPPRLAVVTPLAPIGPELASFVAALALALGRDYRVDLFTPEVARPELGEALCRCSCIDGRLFDRTAAIREYRAIVYPVALPYDDHPIDERMTSRPGILACLDLPESLEGRDETHARSPAFLRACEDARSILVHSPASLERVRAMGGAIAEKARWVPLGVDGPGWADLVTPHVRAIESPPGRPMGPRPHPGPVARRTTDAEVCR